VSETPFRDDSAEPAAATTSTAPGDAAEDTTNDATQAESAAPVTEPDAPESSESAAVDEPAPDADEQTAQAADEQSAPAADEPVAPEGVADGPAEAAPAPLDAPAPPAPPAPPADLVEAPTDAPDAPQDEPAPPAPPAPPVPAEDGPKAPEDEPTPPAPPVPPEHGPGSPEDKPAPPAPPVPPEHGPGSPEDKPAPPAPPADGPRPTPKPGSIPTPKAMPTKPAAPAPAGAAPAPAGGPAVAPQPALDPALSAAAAKFGRVDEEGNVFVQDGDTERVVGQFPDAANEEEALGMYVRRYLDLAAQVALLETRLGNSPAKEAGQTHRKLTEQLTDAAAVGDLPSLRERLAAIEGTIEVEREKARVARAEAKAAALVERTAIIERAEAIAAQNPSNVRWKSAGEELRGLLDTWKEHQRKGPRLDKPDEDGLWKRFSAARTTFDKQRKAFFQKLDANQDEVRRAKERLITRAEELSGSTEWGPTSGAYRDLMDQWKAAGRASKKVDDELWARFRAAQQRFFDNRTAANAAIDREYEGNLEVKLAILEEVEALLPITNVDSAKAALRPLQDRWEEAGKVPRAEMQRVEGRMRAVEKAIRDAEDQKWKKSDPEKKARADGMLAQLEDAIAGLEQDLSDAQAGGDPKRITAAQEALDARRAWLKQIQESAQG
jgi:hypothetical protein